MKRTVLALGLMALVSPAFANGEKSEIQCLARNIYFEARSESVEGQRAVALVTMNRVQSERFPDTVCGVVHQAVRNASGVPVRNKCQFSWFCDGKPDKIKNKEAWNEALSIAKDVYHDQSDDITGGATFYHTHAVHPYWAKKFRRVGSIDSHIFYAMK